MVMVCSYSPHNLLLVATLALLQNLQTVKWMGLALPQALASHHQKS